MSKISDTFRTPPKLFNELDSALGPFFWDACCDKDNCLVKNQFNFLATYLKENDYDYLQTDLKAMADDMLQPYKDCTSIFMNPPYSNPMPFIKKAWEDSKHFRVVMLLKADMSTKWFNYALETRCGRVVTEYQSHYNLSFMCRELLLGMDNERERMKIESPNMAYNGIGVLHLRNRVKFYVSEEVFEEDAKKNGHKFKNKLIPATINNGECTWDLMETKNYKRVEDGIVSRSGANFPSMILVLDRRGSQ